ncbi:MAG TPA: hypothetical protein VJV40_08810 [Thermodesulfobacteriota bacterium]|nr:hypothetical protein [Thermodesulfobacteriota bacterium]
MKIIRIYSDDKGESHFGGLDIALADSGPIGRLSERFPVKSIIFRENDAGYDYDWHNAPERQYILLLDGEIEIEVSDGEKRIFRGGDVIFVEDTEGKGHRTRVTNDRPRRSVFVTLT